MKTLNKFEFKAGVGAESTYDWEAILGGKIVQLEEGKDYECKTLTMQTLVRNAARKRGMTVQMNTNEAGIVVQAKKASAEQIETWAAQDVERKEKARQKRAEAKEEANDDGE